MQDTTAEINKLMLYANQIDPFVTATKPALETWVYALHNVNLRSAHQVVVEYYATRLPSDRDPVTPGYIRRHARKLEARANRDLTMCKDHDENYRSTCSACRDEIAVGDRQPWQQGEAIKQPVPPPPGIRKQLSSFIGRLGIDK